MCNPFLCRLMQSFRLLTGPSCAYRPKSDRYPSADITNRGTHTSAIIVKKDTIMLEKFLPRIDFDSYEDFKANYTVNVPEDFNFGFDIVDGWAKE